MSDFTLAVSTCSFSHRYQDGYAMLSDAAELGYEYVELSHGIPLYLMPGILKAAQEGVMKISSLHNFCPLPSGVTQAAPNLYQPSALDSRERRLWQRYTLQTIDYAKRLSAKVVVMHMGSVPFFWTKPQQKLTRLSEGKEPAELREDPDYQAYYARLSKKLAKKAPKVLHKVHLELESMLQDIDLGDLVLGVENRDNPLELPDDAHYLGFIEGLSESCGVRAWHDTGHAMVKSAMGLLEDYEASLEAQSELLAGWHLKDATASGRENLPLGQGDIDFKRLRRFMKPDQVFVVELSPRTSPEELKASRVFMEDLLAS